MSRTQSNPDGPIDRHGQDKPVVVIRVFTNQINAPGRTNDERRPLSKSLNKCFYDAVFQRHELLL
jgi:hypothetical protein